MQQWSQILVVSLKGLGMQHFPSVGFDPHGSLTFILIGKPTSTMLGLHYFISNAVKELIRAIRQLIQYLTRIFSEIPLVLKFFLMTNINFTSVSIAGDATVINQYLEFLLCIHIIFCFFLFIEISTCMISCRFLATFLSAVYLCLLYGLYVPDWQFEVLPSRHSLFQVQASSSVYTVWKQFSAIFPVLFLLLELLVLVA